jgi:putative ABC transport system permease protein
VAAAGATTILPFSGSEQLEPFLVEGRPAPRPGQEVFVDARVVTPGYFAAMGIPLVAGRTLLASDGPESPRVAVISQALARAQWPGEDPLGRTIRIGYDEGGKGITVVGVVGDVRHSDLAAEMRGHVYEAHTQRPRFDFFVVARTHGDAALFAQPVRAAVAAVDPEQPVAQMRTLEELVTGSLAGRRLNLTLLGVFAALALLLAAIGVYGLARNTVTQRSREIGLRLALGASPLKVLGLVLADSGRAVLTGALTGLLAALLAGRVLASLVFGISTTDPTTYASVLVVLLVAGLGAIALPALRAVRVDPGVVLRED